MYILCDGNWNKPEIEISDSPQGLIKLGKICLNIRDDIEIQTEKKVSNFYSENIDSLMLKLSHNSDDEKFDLLQVYINNKKLIFQGSKQSFCKLGMSLLNYFDEDSKKNDHFHLFYVEGDSLLAPTSCSLIFLCLSNFS